MKTLKKIISLLMIILIFMTIISSFVSAATLLDVNIRLEYGSKGEQVKLLQTELNSVINAGLTVDGSFGSGTKTAVINFQKKYGLEADGIVGTKTAKKLNEVYSANNNETVINNTLDVNCVLKYGSKGEQVKLLQTELNSVMNAGLTVDGSFGSGTKTAVINFQKKYGLEADGIVGFETAKKLNEAYLTNTNDNTTTDNNTNNNNEIVLNKTLDVRCNLKKGSKGEQVKLLQTELNSVMNAGLTVDGSFGSGTKNAVINFQKKYNLEADGIVGFETAGKLNVAYLASTNYIIVNATNVNVRTEPSKDSTKLGTIYQGDAYATYGTATASNGITWYKIKYNGMDSYICSSYVTKTGIFLDLSEQILKMYKNGKLVLESPVITGNNGENDTISHKTPTGTYLFDKSDKATDRVLRGTNDDGSEYESPVDYWMPFITDRGIGFHDATWRSNSQFYNKNTYLTNGSHACVNMPHANAKQLYNLITSNIYVYVYNQK